MPDCTLALQTIKEGYEVLDRQQDAFAWPRPHPSPSCQWVASYGVRSVEFLSVSPASRLTALDGLQFGLKLDRDGLHSIIEPLMLFDASRVEPGESPSARNAQLMSALQRIDREPAANVWWDTVWAQFGEALGGPTTEAVRDRVLREEVG